MGLCGNSYGLIILNFQSAYKVDIMYSQGWFLQVAVSECVRCHRFLAHSDFYKYNRTIPVEIEQVPSTPHKELWLTGCFISLVRFEHHKLDRSWIGSLRHVR